MPPRRYLRADQRREQLLDAAADLVGKRGWGALGIVPLAAAAGVSRQLVYEHFTDTSDLLESVLRHSFERAHLATARIVSTATDDGGSVIRRAYDVFLGLPRAQRRALRALAADDDPNAPQLDRARHVMRNETLCLWVPFVRARTGLTEPKARALAWMFTTAAWALSDLIEDGTLSPDEARELLTDVVAGAVVTAEKKRAPRAAASRVATSRAAPRPRRS